MDGPWRLANLLGRSRYYFAIACGFALGLFGIVIYSDLNSGPKALLLGLMVGSFPGTILLPALRADERRDALNTKKDRGDTHRGNNGYPDNCSRP